MKPEVFSGAAPPPFLLGAVVLFWGWHHALLPVAIIMALALESPRYIAIRLEFSDKDFRHLADFTSVLWLLVAVYLFVQYSIHGLFKFFILLPLLFFLLLLGQRFSTAGNMRLSSLFISMRRAEKQQQHAYFKRLCEQRVDISYPYIFVAILSTSVARQPGFFVGLAIFTAWALWPLRPQRYRLWVWVLLLSLALGAGYAGQNSLRILQNQVERWLLTWFEYRLWRFRDPYQQQTAIGDIGELKQSERVLLRVEAEAPLLLREATYINYLNGLWRTPRPAHFKGFTFPADERHWELAAPPSTPGRSVRIALYPYGGKAMLPLPNGTYALHLPPGPDVQGNTYAALRISDAPGMVTYRAYYSAESTPLDRAPDEHDLELPPDEADYLRAKAQALGLVGLSAKDAAARVAAFFEEGFGYSLTLGGRGNTPPLETFLEQRRAGHCEYFATAGVLLLRAAGIPARYAAGYAAQEYSAVHNVYLVRRRHAHAWILVYIDKRWQDLDTTPAVWAEIEAETAPWWQIFYDSGAWIYYAFAYLRWSDSEEDDVNNDKILWLIVPLLMILFWRLAQRRQHSNAIVPTPAKIPQQGLDSEFFRIVALLNTHYPRQSEETLALWLQRISMSQQIDSAALKELLQLHQRYRFDPQGLSPSQQQYLQQKCTVWLQNFHAHKTK
jgi:protein-glutamine gamma-glutamyltransferase